MPTPVEIQPHDQAVVDAVAAAGRPVGFASAPDGALEDLRSVAGPHEYVVVWPISGQRLASSVVDSVGDAELVYQTTIVARTAMGARWLISRIEAELYGVAIPGRVVVRVTPDETGDVRPDQDLVLDDGQPVYIATPRWRLWTSTPHS